MVPFPPRIMRSCIFLGVIKMVQQPSIAANQFDWDNLYNITGAGDYYAISYNDAVGVQAGNPLSGTAGLLLIIAGYPICFSTWNNIGVFLGGYHSSPSVWKKVGAV